MKRISFQCCCALFAALLYAGTPAFGQNDRATITGTASDPTGAVIAGVQALATDTGTGASYSGTTNNAGIYTIPGLPVGTYRLTASQPGFKDFVRTDIILIAAQVLQLDVRMVVGSADQSVTVSGGVPLLETETTSVSMTMEQSALRDLPLDATGGRDAMNLMLATTPLVNSSQGGQSTTQGTQNWNIFTGQADMTNSVYIDGVESTAGMQGQIATPGLDALSEVQLITSPSDAEFGTGGGVEMFQIKSGTNQFHGSVFEFLENEDLNANSWSNNYYRAQCSPSDAACLAANARGFDRFNDYGASAGGPVWKNHSFIFGAFEIYKNTNYQINPNSVTVPTPQMLTGDFSQLLTGGAQQGTIPGPSGGPWINPCTGQPYQYGQIIDPLTQQVVNGATCATPFQGNIIPPGRVSSVSKQVAGIYSKYYTPTLSTRIYDNFPSLVSSTPSDLKFSLDLKFDHTFSTRHHLSAGLDHVSWRNLSPQNNGLNYPSSAGPLSNDTWGFYPNVEYRIVDTYSITPTLLNAAAVGFNENHASNAPQNPVNPTSYGITGPATPYFPRIIYDNESNNVANGVLENDVSTNYQGYYDTDSYQYQDTMQWTKGRHSIKFGGTVKAQEMNAAAGANLATINFYSDTGGPTDPGLTPYVGFAFANEMLGDVQSSRIAVNNTTYPRQTQIALFFQDDYRLMPKLTLNLGLRWDMTGRDHEKNGDLINWDPTVQNPNWAPSMGAWVFSKGPGTTFETNQDYHQFGPHIGGAYRLNNKLVARASYGIFYVPDSLFNSSGNVGPSGQTELAFPVNQVTNSIPGSIAYDWDNGYPGINQLSVQNSTNTEIATTVAMYTHPDYLHLGYTQNWYVGFEYAVNNSVVVDASYVANRGRNLNNPARSLEKWNSPDFSSVYNPLLLSGHLNDTITNASEAAADGIPYPYPGFVGSAYTAISPFPQLANVGSFMQDSGNPDDSSVSAFNSLVIEVKARAYHGLYLDFSDTVSKMTGNFIGLEGWGNDWWDPSQNMSDWLDEKHWVQYLDQRNLLKGYATYLLPFGKGGRWLSGASTALDEAVGGWELGYYGNYGTGIPLGPISSSFQLPGYFNFPCCGNDRASLAPGISARELTNHFGRHPDLANVSDPSNNDFNPDLFVSTTAVSPFGNTPFAFNHWRWNSQPALENMSLLKHFNAGGERVKAIIGVQFFDVFNRHYYGAPGMTMGQTNFGQVTSVSGYRYGQVSGRISW